MRLASYQQRKTNQFARMVSLISELFTRPGWLVPGPWLVASAPKDSVLSILLVITLCRYTCIQG
jgi:hypothetical protein